jgi:hypothetical protein
MAEKGSMSEFERLLQERSQIEDWLKKLESSGDKTPSGVRERVQADYRKRLDEVQGELNGHRDEITGALERHRQVRDELLKQQADANERRAEAELRHTVGEFDDTKWGGIRNEIDGSLKKIGEELNGVETEVADLEKALDSITAGPGVDSSKETPAELAEEAPPATDRTTPKTPEHLPPPLKEAEHVPPAQEPTPATEAKSDSLEFLDVDADEKDAEPVPEPKAEAVPMPPDAAEQLSEGRAGAAGPGASAGASVGAAGVTSFSNNAEQPKKGVAKTLKCGECGAMNLPTEWYCERCGAELAAL